MHRTEPTLAAAAICLAALAGFVDAMAFTSLGGFFASFMSGNSTRLGVGLARGVTSDAVTAISLVLSFVSGVILASVIVRARPVRAQPFVLGAVTLLLVAGAVAGMLRPGPIALLLLAAAMGCLNGVIHRDGEVAVGVTYLTGALVKLGQKLAGALMGDADRWAWLPYLLLWAGFVAGVIMGANANFLWGWRGLWLAAGASAVLTVLMARMARGAAAVKPGPWSAA